MTSQTTSIAQPLRASFCQLGLYSDDVARLADFYSTALGYQFAPAQDGLFGVARDRQLAISQGAPRTLAHAGYAVADDAELVRLEERLGAADIEYARVCVSGFLPGALQFADPDGNRFIFGLASPTPDALGAVGGRAARIQHIVFASTDIGRLLSFFTDVIGFVLSDRVVDDAGQLRTVFLRCSHEHHSLAIFSASENRLDHHCYEAVEWNLIRDWADHFADRRIPLKWGPGRHGPGDNLFVFIHDSDGNWVEISAELEQVAPDRPVGEWPHEERTLNSWGIGLLRS